MSVKQSPTLEKIREVNPGGISDNILIARLNRILNEHTLNEATKKPVEQPQKPPQELQQSAKELGQLLTKGQTPQEYKQQLKQDYLSYYLNKFGVESQANAQTKQLGVLNQLERFAQRTKEREAQRQTITAPIKEVQKNTFVGGIIDNLVTSGRKLSDSINAARGAGRIRGDSDRMNSQSSQPKQVFPTQKESGQELNIKPNNLSQPEAVPTNLDPQQQRQLQSRIQKLKRNQKNNDPELGD